jgi:hypothetical protein
VPAQVNIGTGRDKRFNDLDRALHSCHGQRGGAIVARFVHIGPSGHERLDYVETARLLRRDIEWRGAVPVSQIRIGTAGQQNLDSFKVTMRGGED